MRPTGWAGWWGFGLGLVALVLGGVSAVPSVALHNAGWGWWLWCLAAPVAVMAALPGGWLRCGFGLGWVAVVMIALIQRPEGDFVIAAQARGLGLMCLALLIIVWSIGTLPKRSRGGQESASLPDGT